MLSLSDAVAYLQRELVPHTRNDLRVTFACGPLRYFFAHTERFHMPSAFPAIRARCRNKHDRVMYRAMVIIDRECILEMSITDRAQSSRVAECHP